MSFPALKWSVPWRIVVPAGHSNRPFPSASGSVMSGTPSPLVSNVRKPAASGARGRPVATRRATRSATRFRADVCMTGPPSEAFEPRHRARGIGDRDLDLTHQVGDDADQR